MAQVTDDLLGTDDAAPDATDSVDSEATAAAGDPESAVATTAATPDSAWGRWRDRRRNRVSKWDRPPDPKDWRFFVGTLGKVLIATGILMFGFVAYQLWGTGIETARAQNALENTFEAAVAEYQAVDEVETTAAVDETDDDDTDDPADGDVVDGTDDEPSTGAGVGGGTPSDVVPGGVDLSDEAVVQNVPIVPEGDAIAKIDIPRLDIENLYVVQGVQLDDLKKGPGHYPDTPLPGQLGNASIAGHRTTYGAPFFDVDQLQPGDEIVVTMITGDRFVYSVTGSQVVTAADSWVIGTRDPNVAELTLTTCHPKYTARDRLVIHSVLVPEKSAQVGEAEFWNAGTREVTVEAGADDAATDERPPGDDPTFDTDTTVPDDGDGAKSQDDDTDVDAETEAGADDERTDAVFLDPTPDPDEPAEDAVAVDDTVAEATTGDEGDVEEVTPSDPDDAEIDAFSEGWFDDEEAWPQIALWGSVLTVISLLAYQLSKKTRHDSIGFMVGILPFSSPSTSSSRTSTACCPPPLRRMWSDQVRAHDLDDRRPRHGPGLTTSVPSRVDDGDGVSRRSTRRRSASSLRCRRFRRPTRPRTASQTNR
ncbi:MAG: sortase [Ilumatobacteraceae bacterium]